MPDLFVHTIVETRPSDPSKDYYVPPSIADRCVVVEKLAWNPTGCRFVACFPYKSFEEPCVSGTDRLRWILIDDARYALACQPACDRGMTLDTRFRDGDCFVSNAAKKLYAMIPERYNGAVAKRARLTLDEKTERLALNEAYCKAYGVRWDEEARDCYLPKGQEIAEFFVGTTFFRRRLISENRRPSRTRPPASPPPPPPLGPEDLELFEKPWRTTDVADEDFDFEKTATTDPATTLDGSFREKGGGLLPEEGGSETVVEELVASLGREIAGELGVHVVSRRIRNFVARRLSAGLASRTVADSGLTSALSLGAFRAIATTTAGVPPGTVRLPVGFGGGSSAATANRAASLAAAKGSMSLASFALGIHGVLSFFADVFDPFEYGKLLGKKQVERLDRKLDLKYFGTDAFRDVRLAPEDVWEMLSDDTDVEKELVHYRKRYDEYMSALHAGSGSVSFGTTTERAAKSTSEQKARNLSTSPWPLWILAGLSFSVTSVCFGRRSDILSVFLCALLLLWIRR